MADSKYRYANECENAAATIARLVPYCRATITDINSAVGGNNVGEVKLVASLEEVDSWLERAAQQLRDAAGLIMRIEEEVEENDE